MDSRIKFKHEHVLERAHRNFGIVQHIKCVSLNKASHVDYRNGTLKELLGKAF